MLRKRSRHSRRRYRQRRYFRRGLRRGKRKIVTSVSRVTGRPFGDQLYCKLYYEGTNQCVGNNVITQVYQSSLFDPDLTGGGHQPRGFDQIAAFYNRYQVMGMKADILINNVSTTAGIIATATWTDTSTTITTYEAAMESPYTKMVNVGIISSNPCRRLKTYMSSAKIHGQRNTTQEDSQQALVTANPADPYYLQLVMANVDSEFNLNNISAYVTVRITFYCRFFEPVLLPAS